MLSMKVLIIRYSSLGDVILTTPIIRAFVRQSSAIVHYITKEVCAPLLEDNPFISKLWIHEKTKIKDLQAQNYDHVIDLQGSLRSVRLKALLGHFRKSYNKERWKTKKFIRSKNLLLAPSHVVLRYFDTVKRFDITYDGQGLDLISTPKVHQEVREKYHIAVVLGGTHITKRLPSSLVSGLIERKDLFFSLLGGTDVNRNPFNEASHVMNYIGRSSLKESIKIIDQSDFVITGDTGLMHAAAALSKPMVVVWGSTSPDMGFRPFYKDASHAKNFDILLGLDCQPCSKYGKKTCPLSHMNCLNEIKTQSIHSRIDDMIAYTAQLDRQKN